MLFQVGLMKTGELPTLEFKTQAELHTWLMAEPPDSAGVWVRVFKKSSKIPSVSFEELLDEGLCFGWSESAWRSYDETSYLQKFTPRKTRGTQSERNCKRIEELIKTGRMTQAGLDAL
jgi:uncharacterized protein YdeI (YjbR/CyaY-like superfamily)